jgi:CBS domain-containing protein
MNFTPKFDTSTKASVKKPYESVTMYMTTNLVTFGPEDEIGDVIRTLMEKQISGAPVLNDKRELIGIISEQDCLRVIIDSVYHNHPISKHVVKDYMNKEIITLTVSDDVVSAANMFLKHRFRRFPVVENGVLRGLVSKRDILAAAHKMQTTTW